MIKSIYETNVLKDPLFIAGKNKLSQLRRLKDHNSRQSGTNQKQDLTRNDNEPQDKKTTSLLDPQSPKLAESLPKIDVQLLNSSSILPAPQIGTERRVKKLSKANLSQRALEPVRASLDPKKKKDPHLAGGDTYLPQIVRESQPSPKKEGKKPEDKDSQPKQ